MKKLSKILTLAVVALMSVVLVACKKTTTKPTTETTTISTTESPFDSIELTAGDEYSVTFWHIWGKEKSASLAAMVEEFKQYMLDKYEVSVNVVSTPQGDYGTLLDKTGKAIAAGAKENIPSVVIGYPDHFATYKKSGSLLSLEPFIYSKNYGIDLSDFITSYMDENNQFDGTTYSLPLSKSAEIMVYNKSITDDLGITIPYDRPLTWTELTAIRDEIYDKNTGKFTYDKNNANLKYLVNYDSSDNLFINFARQFNAKYTTQNGELLVTDDSTVLMIKVIQNYVEQGLLSVPINYADSASYGSDYFKQQNMVFTIGSTAGTTYNIPTELNSTVKYLFDCGVAMVPQFDALPDGSTPTMSVVQQGPNVCLLDNGTDEEALVSWLLVKYLTTMDQYSPDSALANEEGFIEGNNNSARFALDTNYFPVTNTAFNSELYSNFMGIAKRYLEAGYDDSILTPQEKEKLVFAQVAYIAYLQKDFYKFDPAFPASSKLLGSATIRIKAGECIDTICKDTKFDARTALQNMLDACTLKAE